MRNISRQQFISLVILMAMAIVTINGVHARAHALQCQATEIGGQSGYSESSPAHQDDCPSGEQHNECDGCDTCASCACHAPLTNQPFQLGYAPIISDLRTSEPFRHLPEVYLSRFIPPQIYA